MRNMIISLCAAVVLVCGVPAAASAIEPHAGNAVAIDDAGNYTPDKPHEPSLAGSSLASSCIDDVPWISYSVVLTDPSNVVTNHTAPLVLSDGAYTVTLTLGTLTDGALSGSILWPGASVDASGIADGWPGWEFTGGSWHTTDGNFAWVRGAISAEVQVNPQISLPLSYPPGTAGCAPLTAAAPATAGLARTGGDLLGPIGIGIGAVAVLAVGTMIVLRRRRA